MKIPKQSATLQQIVDFYRTSSAFRRLSISSQKDYDYQLDAVCDTVVEEKPLGLYRNKQIKVRHLMQAYELWLNDGIRSANYRKSVLSAAWKHGMRYDIMTHNPVTLIQTVSSPPRRQTWERDQVVKFLDYAYSDFRWRSIGLIVHMAYSWGQRVGDMRLLSWSDLDLEQCRLDLSQSKRGAEIHLPISEELCVMLRQQKEDFGFQDIVAPYPDPDGTNYRAYNKGDIARHINKILEEVNLPLELNAMDLRRTAVTEMMEGNVDITGIMQVTGHQNVASLKPYMVNTLSGATKALAARKDNE